MGWGGKWEGGSGWGTHVNPWLIHVNVWQKPLQHCKVISLQLIKNKGEKKKDLMKDLNQVLWFKKDVTAAFEHLQQTGQKLTGLKLYQLSEEIF